jgi:ethanolamine ammonia-lyase large subunit
MYKTKLRGESFTFSGVKEVLAKANEEKSGDVLAGIAAASALERIAAKQVLAELPLSVLRENPVVPYEKDEVTRLNQDGLDEDVYQEIQGWTTADLREWLLDEQTTGEDIHRISRALSAEMIAGTAKLMSNLDLVCAAAKIRVTARCNTVLGGSGIFASRLQPNHTTDNPEGVSASVFEGLSYGCGDALIGLNPVNDSDRVITEILNRFEEIKNRFEIPTQICVLGHITTQLQAVRSGAPCDIIFQSIAGSQKGNEAFGFTTEHIREARELLRQKNARKRLPFGGNPGPNVLYFETGQGSELSSDSHYGADQVTLEARCYAYARVFEPFMVNTVVGFIGPEYLYDGRQVIRAGLEDHFMGKLSGLPMGCDCCYTNHMKADQNDIENLALLLAQAGANYLIAVPAGDDIMLNYQTTSYHDIPAIRAALNLKPTPEFGTWLEKMGITGDGRLSSRAGDAGIFV